MQRKLCFVWCDYKSIIYYKLLTQNQTINFDGYFRQLENLDEKTRRTMIKRKEVVFQQTMQDHMCLLQAQSYTNLSGTFYQSTVIAISLAGKESDKEFEKKDVENKQGKNDQVYFKIKKR